MLFEVLLTFRGIPTCPTEVLEAFRTLHMGAATLGFHYRYPTFWIGTALCAVLHKQLCKGVFAAFVALENRGYCVILLDVWQQVNSVNRTALERMHAIFAVETKHKVTECTSTLV
jgi:hypothetical protein